MYHFGSFLQIHDHLPSSKFWNRKKAHWLRIVMTRHFSSPRASCPMRAREALGAVPAWGRAAAFARSDFSSEAVSWTRYKCSGWLSGPICRGCQTRPQRRRGPWLGEWRWHPAPPVQPRRCLLHRWSLLWGQSFHEADGNFQAEARLMNLCLPVALLAAKSRIRNVPQSMNICYILTVTKLIRLLSHWRL